MRGCFCVARYAVVVVTGCVVASALLEMLLCGYWLCGYFCVARDVVVVVTGCAVASELLDMLLLWLLVVRLLLRC